jgi:hypothetical protein
MISWQKLVFYQNNKKTKSHIECINDMMAFKKGISAMDSLVLEIVVP